MGGQSSKNEIDSFISSVINVVTSSSQQCATFGNQIQGIVIKGVVGNINISNLDWSQWASVNVKCAQQTAVDNKAEQKITELIQQTAKTISQALDFNPGSADAKNITRLTTQLATSIVNTFKQTCATQFNQKQYIKISDAKGNINLNMFNWQQGIDDVTQCIQNSKAVNSAKNTLSQKTTQTASSIRKNILSFLGNFGFLIIILLIVIVLPFIGGISALTKPHVLFTILFLIFAYLTAAYFWKGWPYKKISTSTPHASPTTVISTHSRFAATAPHVNPPPTPQEVEAIKKHNRKLLLIFGSLATVSFFIMIYMNRKRKQTAK